MEIEQASSRMEFLSKAAEHIAIVNFPEKPVDMELLQQNELDVNPAELPVLRQLIRDIQTEESTESDTEDLPDKQAPTAPVETSPVKSLEAEKSTSPVAKRSKVVITTSVPNSPVIQAKRPDRSMDKSKSPFITLRGKDQTRKLRSLIKLYVQREPQDCPPNQVHHKWAPLWPNLAPQIWKMMTPAR